ncbi:ligand-binding sensor domain-containing protein [Chondrinema litorale]|uniref:ligand-binding sensor domain-containing protein n=1 Tax=Chondrinema litorale TaxID=2994555 RepID=UPI0025429607|nr:sensor histidine kinase [Chondrinema litorale]UZR98772.1 triple tyrosine motif-containing protein [Chondrinema litorale]
MPTSKNLHFTKEFSLIICTFICIFFTSYSVFSQEDKLYFKQYDTKQGLSNNTIRRILKDSRGFLWIATIEGLNRFNGYEFEVFMPENEDSTTISNKMVSSLAEDSKGRIWLGTNNGLNCYNPETNQFTQYLHHVEDSTGLSHPMVTFVTATSDGYIWAATNGGGLNRLNPETGEFQVFKHNESDSLNISQDYLLCLKEDNKGNLWIGQAGNGLSKFDRKTGKFINYYFSQPDKDMAFKANVIRDIYIDDAGKIWLASYYGLHKFNPETKTHQYFVNLNDVERQSSANSLHAIVSDGKNGMWLASYNGGLIHFNPQNNSFKNYTAEQTDGLTHEAFFDLYADENRLWLGSSGGGLFKLEYSDNPFHFLFPTAFSAADNFPSTPNTWVEGLKGELILTYHNQGLVAYDVEKQKSLKVAFLEKLNPLVEGLAITSMCWDKEDNLWLGTRRNGLYKYQPKTENLTHFEFDNNQSALTHHFIKYLLCDEQGRILAGTPSGLSIYNPETASFESWGIEDESKIPNANITALFEDSQNRIWVGTELGLHLLQLDKNSFQSFYFDGENQQSLNDNSILSIAEDQEQHVWVGTPQGLNRIDAKLNVTRVVGENKLESELINTIQIDSDGILWLGTSKGISRVEVAQKQSNSTIEILQSINYSFDEQLENTTFSHSSHLKSSGKFVFRSTVFPIYFDPDSIQLNTFQPPLYITDFKIFNKSVSSQANEDYDRLNQPEKSIAYTKSISISYKSKFIAFDFAALDFKNPKKISYAYRLLGFDEEWIYSDSRRYASYTNLSPSEYEFQVKATNADGVWLKNPVSLKVEVIPPYWQRWWFIALVLTAIFALAYLIHRYRLQRALELERLRIKIASDLHDDIGATLTKISLYADLMGSGADSGNRQQLIGKIAEMGRNALKSLSDIVWAIDARNDTLGNLINKIQDFALNLLESKNITASFKTEGVNPETFINAEKRQHLYLICKEAINNIAKHSEAQHVTVEFIKNKSTFDLKIYDDGKGLHGAQRNGNGLRNMEERAKNLGGKLQIHNENGLLLEVKDMTL